MLISALCDGGSDIFIGICKIIAACRRAGVRLIVYDPVNKIIAHGEDIHADGLAVSAVVLSEVFSASPPAAPPFGRRRA